MVKELYFDGKEVIGYAVMIKVRKNSGNSGQGWLFYESFDGTNKDAIFGRGLPECADCHSVGVDFLRSSSLKLGKGYLLRIYSVQSPN